MLIRPGAPIMAGWMKKKIAKGFPKLKPWHNRYFVLYTETKELRYYKKVVRSLARVSMVGSLTPCAAQCQVRGNANPRAWVHSCQYD